MKPFLLSPAFKDYLWGGERLKSEYNKDSQLTPLAESWELSCHPAGHSIVATGPNKGKTLAEVLASPEGANALGSRCESFERFPVLVKLIDAAKALSIQVHPSDEYALANENSYGKTEVWIVLDAAPDSFIYFGVERETTREELREAIENNTLEHLLRRRPVKAGDVIFIPSGTIHAIGAGILVTEVQQNSDLTYRVYDFGRLGADGRPRELHIDKALAVSTLTPTEESAVYPRESAGNGAYMTRLAQCAYFDTAMLEVENGTYQGDAAGESFRHLLCVEGSAIARCGGEEWKLQKGDSWFVPADAGSFEVEGTGRFLVTGI